MLSRNVLLIYCRSSPQAFTRLLMGTYLDYDCEKGIEENVGETVPGIIETKPVNLVFGALRIMQASKIYTYRWEDNNPN